MVERKTDTRVVPDVKDETISSRTSGKAVHDKY